MTTMQFDRVRLMQRVMAIAALRAIESGDPEKMIGNSEAEALGRLAGAAVGMAALKLQPYAVDFDPEVLTITLELRPGTETGRAFRLCEAALAARLSGDDAEFVELMHGAREALADHSLPRRITPNW